MNDTIGFTALIAAIVVGWGVALPRQWRGKHIQADELAATTLSLPRPFQLAVKRTLMSALICMTALLGTIGLPRVTDSNDGVWGKWLPMALAIVALAAIFVLFPAVALFNRPKWAVPPPYRQDESPAQALRRHLNGRRKR
jgi:hypothetical protein